MISCLSMSSMTAIYTVAASARIFTLPTPCIRHLHWIAGVFTTATVAELQRRVIDLSVFALRVSGRCLADTRSLSRPLAHLLHDSSIGGAYFSNMCWQAK